MLIAAKQICSCSLESIDDTDKTVGSVKDLLFDGPSWQVRYIDIDTGHWLPGRRVILSPESIQMAEYGVRRITTSLTKEQVENSPPLGEHLPVTRQKQNELASYYAWSPYYAYSEALRNQTSTEGDPDLRSIRSVTGYQVQAKDGEIGSISDFIVDDHACQGTAWEILYLVVDTRNWLPGKYVLIPPKWAGGIDWNTQHVLFDVTREKIEKSPEYDPAEPINRRYEEVFYDYYGRPRYWQEKSKV